LLVFAFAIKNLFPLCDLFRALGGHKLVVAGGAFPVTTDFFWFFLVDGDDAAAATALWALQGGCRLARRARLDQR